MVLGLEIKRQEEALQGPKMSIPKGLHLLHLRLPEPINAFKLWILPWAQVQGRNQGSKFLLLTHSFLRLLGCPPEGRGRDGGLGTYKCSVCLLSGPPPMWSRYYILILMRKLSPKEFREGHTISGIQT